MKKDLKYKLKDFQVKKYFNSDTKSRTDSKLHLTQVQLLQSARKILELKYSVNEASFQKKKINELIYNEDSLYACIFKEFLIYEDDNEFLKKYYIHLAGINKLRNITEFYDKYSKMFPNYIILSESKILYKNIQKKQKMIDKLQEMKKEEERERNNKTNKRSKAIFNTTANDSIMNESNSFALNVKFIYNYKEDDSDKSFNKLEKIIEAIDEADKTANNLTTRRELIAISQKNNLFNSELNKFHQSQSPLPKKNILKPNHGQNASSSTNTTSILSTNNNYNNNPKEKSKVFEYKLNHHLKTIAKINISTITQLKKKTNIVPSILSSPRQRFRTINSPNNSFLNKKSLVHSQSQSGSLIYNQLNQKMNKKKITNTRVNSNSNSNLLNNSNNCSKILQQKKLNNNKYFEAEYCTHRAAKLTGFDLFKVNDLNQPEGLLSPNSILSESQQQQKKHFKCNSIRSTNISPIIRSKNNSPNYTNRRQKSLIESEKGQEDNNVYNRIVNYPMKMALKRKYAKNFVLSKLNINKNTQFIIN